METDKLRGGGENEKEGNRETSAGLLHPHEASPYRWGGRGFEPMFLSTVMSMAIQVCHHILALQFII